MLYIVSNVGDATLHLTIYAQYERVTTLQVYCPECGQHEGN
jgi:hypothetical protein